jgi:molybdopterin molybdotransferase
MVSFEEALKIGNQAAFTLPKENVLLEDAMNRVLAEEVISDMDMPPFDKSAMDGFACRREDLSEPLEIVETIKAGDVPSKIIGKNQCARIMTGGKVPQGADCVIMVEQTEMVGENFVRFNGSKTSDNIARRAEDIKLGEVVLKKGVLIQPQHVAVLASVGCVTPLVYKQPRVAVLTTGDEIVEPHEKPRGTSIRNSNGIQLVSQIKKMGALASYMGIVGDTPEKTDRAIKVALENHDVLIFTGGVSMGDYDFVTQVLKDNNFDIRFEKVAVKPGRPTVFGKKGNQFVFGLPGNPVSSFIIFELIVKPFLYKLMNHNHIPTVGNFPIGLNYSRKKADRIAWTPVSLENGFAVPVDYHGSAHIHSLCFAQGLMAMDSGVSEFRKGEMVHVRFI